ncbi:hypothetical protein KSP40_PGU011447 [Platanthera guangdongensis]|uniref:Transposase (putative) gypsy type domain-containing protein n=1 Tax=Platanthera guangdongensis TaxID=2320717 RepID=A0ABR2LMQ0_9ASPA
MGGGGGDVDGRSKCAWTFSEHNFPRAIISEREYLEALGDHIPAGFSARRPAEGEKINDLSGNELAIPLAHFEVGLRLPLWPEVRQVLKYFGVVPGQMTPNSVAIMVGFACFLREERVEFNLAVFRKLFSFRANRDGTAYFSSAHLKVRETVNKSHNWLKRFLFVKGDFGNVPFSPVQLSEASYRPPSLGGHEADLCGFFAGKNYEVAYLSRHLDDLAAVPPGGGLPLASALSYPFLLCLISSSWQASVTSPFILPTRAPGSPPGFSPERRPRMPLSATPRRSRPRSGRAVDSPLPHRKWRRLRVSNPLRAKGKARPRPFCQRRTPLPWSLRPATSPPGRRVPLGRQTGRKPPRSRCREGIATSATARGTWMSSASRSCHGTRSLTARWSRLCCRAGWSRIPLAWRRISSPSACTREKTLPSTTKRRRGYWFMRARGPSCAAWSWLTWWGGVVPSWSRTSRPSRRWRTRGRRPESSL